MKKAPIASNAAVSSELAASTMAFSSSGSALEEILGDRQLFETQFGISYDEAPLDSDESDLEVEICEEFSDDENQAGDMLNGIYCYRNITHNKL